MLLRWGKEGQLEALQISSRCLWGATASLCAREHHHWGCRQSERLWQNQEARLSHADSLRCHHRSVRWTCVLLSKLGKNLGATVTKKSISLHGLDQWTSSTTSSWLFDVFQHRGEECCLPGQGYGSTFRQWVALWWWRFWNPWVCAQSMLLGDNCSSWFLDFPLNSAPQLHNITLYRCITHNYITSYIYVFYWHINSLAENMCYTRSLLATSMGPSCVETRTEGFFETQ